MDICIEKSCCFTGHRPQKLKGTEAEIRSKLREEISAAVKDGYNTFISGMAMGVDVWAAQEVLEIKKSNSEIKHICAVPFNGVESNRSDKEKQIFNNILALSDGAVYLSPKYARWSFLARDKWMVNHASRVIAVFNGTPGGTEFTVNYAKTKNRDIHFINDAALRNVTE